MTAGTLEGITSSLGDELTELAGEFTTRLTAQVLPEQLFQTDLNNASGDIGEAAVSLAVDFAWDGTLTVLSSDTTGVVVGKFIRLDSDRQAFEVASVVANVSVTILNPSTLTVPTGTGPSSQLVPTIITLASGAFLTGLVGKRFRVLSGALAGVSELINERLTATTVRLRRALQFPPTVFAAASWEIVTEPEQSVPVENTLDWASVGRFIIDGTLFRYFSKTLTTFEGIEYFNGAFWIPGPPRRLAPLEVVVDFSLAAKPPRSAWRAIRHSLLVDLAEGVSLNVIGNNLGVQRPPELTDDDTFREMIKAVAYTPRGTIFAMERFLDAILGETLIQSSEGDLFPASVSGDTVSVGNPFDVTIVKGDRFRIKTDGDFLDDFVLIEELGSAPFTSLTLQSDRLGVQTKIEWEIARPNWEIFEDLTLGSINHPARVYLRENLANEEVFEGKAFVEGTRIAPTTGINTVDVTDDPIAVAGLRHAPEGGPQERLVAFGVGAVSTDLGLTISLLSGAFPAAIQPGDFFILSSSRFSGAAAVVLTNGGATLTLGLVDGASHIAVESDGSLGFNFNGASWKVVRDKTNCRFYKPSSGLLIEYPGDAGTTVWNFIGSGSEAATVLLSTDPVYGSSIQMIDNNAAEVTAYSHPLRVDPEDFVEFEMYFDLAFHGSLDTADGRQICMQILDGERVITVGIVESGGGTQDNYGFVDATTGAIIGSTKIWGGVAATQFIPGMHVFIIRKHGRGKVELFVKGYVASDAVGVIGLQLTEDYTSFPTVSAYVAAPPPVALTAERKELVFGLLSDTTGPAGNVVKYVDWRVIPKLDHWNTQIPSGETIAPRDFNDLAAGGLFDVSDAGRTFRISDFGTANPGGGNSIGEWLIETRVSSNRVTLQGITKKDGRFTLADTSRFIVRSDPEAFIWPNIRGHAIEFLTGSNIGVYQITAALNPVDFADFGVALPGAQALAALATDKSEIPAFEKTNVLLLDSAGGVPPLPNGFTVEDEDVEWRIVPALGTDSGVVFGQTVETGTFAGSILTARGIGLPFPVGTPMEVGRTEVLSAYVLDEAADNNRDINPPNFDYYPFYLMDNWGFIRRVIEDLTASGVLPIFDKLLVDAAGPHIIED